MSDHIHKSHNKSSLMYHFVCSIKYRRKVLSDAVVKTFKEICFGIEERYEIHFLIQSVPMNSPKKIINAVKSITAKEIFLLHYEVKLMLWGGKFGLVDIM